MNSVLSRFNASVRTFFLSGHNLQRLSCAVFSRKIYNSASPFQPKFVQTYPCLLNYNQVRWKKKNKQSANKQEELNSDDEEDDTIDYDAEPGSKVGKVTLSSLRIDLVLKSCLGLARNKVEVLFYEGKIRLNNAKLSKKSEMVKIGDVLDIIIGPSPDNPENFMFVNRIEILGAEEKDATKLTLHYSKQNKLLVQK